MIRPNIEEWAGEQCSMHREECIWRPGGLISVLNDVAETLSSRWRVETNEAGESEALWAMQWNHDTISIQKALGSPCKSNIMLCILENSSGCTMLHGLERNKPRGKGAAPIILMITAGCYHEDEEKWISLKDIEHLGREDEWVCSEGGKKNDITWALVWTIWTMDEYFSFWKFLGR